jgi:hypothetical protein
MGREVVVEVVVVVVGGSGTWDICGKRRLGV